MNTPLQFVATFTPEGGARVQLQRTIPARGLFGRARVELLPPSAWLDADTTGHGARILDMIDDGSASGSSDGAVLPPSVVAALDESDAVSLGLPQVAPLVLSLRSKGLITDDFSIATRWVRTNGTDIAAQVIGAHAMIEGRSFRLPEPLFTLLVAAQKVNAAQDVAIRQGAFAELRQLLAGHSDQVALDGVLQDTRVAFAGNFSLQLSGSVDGTDFNPVLFAPRVGDAATSGEIIDEDGDNLLTPKQQSDFARLFRSAAGKRRSYLLPDGLLLFVDPGLLRVLEVVGEKQRAPAAERRSFASSPRRAIAEALGVDAEPIESMFIETAQYSERVTGIDPWLKPVLPWVKAKPNSWLPDSFGLMVGDPPDQTQITLEPDDVADAITRVEQAMDAGTPSVLIGTCQVPATTSTLEALKGLKLLEDSAEASSPERVEPPAILTEKLFLQVRDNLEDVAYAPLARPQSASTPPPKVPPTVKTALKAHQIEGFQWIVECWRSGRPGALLADDMGLGKTLQALSFFCWLRQSGARPAPVLIVAPTGLLANWQAEIARHLSIDALGPVVRAYGDGLKWIRKGSGTDITTGGPRLNIDDWREAGIVLTTYETLRDYHMSIAQVGFAAVAFDEAQRIKNPAAQITRTAKALRARFTIALTGTPVENRLQDLWSIADVVHPGLLGSSKNFEEQYGAANLESLRELNTKLTASAVPWPPFMMRRMKTDHVEGLTKKSIVERVVTMPPAQAAAYSAAINRALATKNTERREAIIQTLARLRSVSLAPELPELGANFAMRSARLLATFSILDEIREKNEKTLIFCESLDLQPLLAAELRRRYGLPHAVPCISGEVVGDGRQKLVDEFQARGSGFDVMILSPRAGGVGLTITAANHVIHLTRWWNPAVEDQATDRVYRIGQTRDVTVWIPIAVHPDPTIAAASFDRRLADLLRRKRDLAQGLLVEPESGDDAAQLLSDILGDDNTEELRPNAVGASEEDMRPSTSQQDASLPLPPTVETSVRFSHARVVKREGQAPPYAIFVDPLRQAQAVKLDIVDPYIGGSRQSCRAVAEFLAHLRSEGVQFDRVSLACWDNDSLEYGGHVNQQAQARAMLEAIQHFKLDDLRIFPEFISRRQKPLHDRWIKARLGDGTEIIWDLGRGVEGVMSPRHPCTIVRSVNAAEGVA